ADRTDPDPDRIGGAHRQRLHRDPEQAEADRHGHDRADRGPQPGEAVRVLEADGPAELEQAGEGEDDPGHAGLLSRRARRSYITCRCRTASNRTTPAATETLRLSMSPGIGMRARPSQCSRVSRRRPSPSPPSTSATLPERSRSYREPSTSPARP